MQPFHLRGDGRILDRFEQVFRLAQFSPRNDEP